MYFSQSVVEEIERQTYENNMPEAIFLSNFYIFDGMQKNYALTCWGMTYQNECNYLPVFEEDRHYLDEHNPSFFIREEVPVGAVFKNNGYYYRVLRGNDGKIELEQAKSVFLFDKSDNLPEPEPEPVQSARIISFDFRNKKQSGE